MGSAVELNLKVARRNLLASAFAAWASVLYTRRDIQAPIRGTCSVCNTSVRLLVAFAYKLQVVLGQIFNSWHRCLLHSRSIELSLISPLKGDGSLQLDTFTT